MLATAASAVKMCCQLLDYICASHRKNFVTYVVMGTGNVLHIGVRYWYGLTRV
jgi:hypothetical protein